MGGICDRCKKWKTIGCSIRPGYPILSCAHFEPTAEYQKELDNEAMCDSLGITSLPKVR